jgi:hypothetical protein
MHNAAVIAIAGRLGNIVFPPLCVNCARPASSRQRIQKAFSTGEEHSFLPGKLIETIRPYFCQECLDASRRESKSDPSLPFKRILHGWPLWPPIAGSFAAGWWLLDQSLPPLWRRGLVALAWGITALCSYGLWRQTRHLAVQPPDSITSAIRFTRDQSGLFEPQWRTFTFRNAEYAGHFRRANQSRLWSRAHPGAQRAVVLKYWASWIFAAALIVALIFAVADELSVPLWDYIAEPFR